MSDILADELKVGDKVIETERWRGRKIGTVVSISPKRKDIKVDFGNYTTTYNKNGMNRIDSWSWTTIEKASDEAMARLEAENKKKTYVRKLKEYDYSKLELEELCDILRLISTFERGGIK